MADPLMPIEMDSRRGTQYQPHPHREMYDYSDTIQQDPRVQLEYRKAQSNAAFHSNMNIPMFSDAAVASGIPPLPIYQGQDSRSYPYDNSRPGGRFESPANHNLYNDHSNKSPYPTPSNMRPSREPKYPSSHIPSTQAVEEGELSEGEFEEVRPQVEQNSIPRFGREVLAEQRRRRGHESMYGPTYDNVPDYEPVPTAPLTDVYGRLVDVNRQRSESSSPYEPPNQFPYESQPSRNIVSHGQQLAYQEQYEPPDEFEHMPSRNRQSQFHHTASRVSTLDSPEPIIVEGNTQLHTSGPLSKSVRDARKDAQNAILNLLPLKVRFQDFIDEGVDEEIVRRQFESLGMPQTQIPASKSHEGSQNSEFATLLKSEDPRKEAQVGSTNDFSAFSMGDRRVQNASTLNEPIPMETPPSNPTDQTMNDNPKIREERKDRIARLLAEKYKRLPSSVLQTGSPISSASPEAASLNKPSQAAAKADKERLLRQKMQALQKSREQRAQKAAAKTTATIVDNHSTDSPAAVEPSPVTRLSLEPPHKSISPFQSSNGRQAMSSIPGLFLAAASSQSPNPSTLNTAPSTVQSGTLRKRPVASDFDRASSPGASYKRPFGHSRNEQPLVIDVSEEESEDDDVPEAEIDDHPGSSSVNPSQSGRGTPASRSMRDLPPLSDFPPRKPFPTTTSTVSTPPAIQPPSKSSVSKPQDLHKKELEIQEMKRKIAEAERKKKAKQNLSGSQTPMSSNSTSSPAMVGNRSSSTDKVEASIQLERLIDDASRQVDQDQRKLVEVHAVEQAKADELKQSEAEQRRLRRAKIASDLPVVNAEVEKGQKRLADLRAEINAIEAAVQEGLDEKQRLAEEMEKLSQEAGEQLHAEQDMLRELALEDTEDGKAPDDVGETHAVGRNDTPLAIEDASIAISDAEQILNTDIRIGSAPDTAIDAPATSASSHPSGLPDPTEQVDEGREQVDELHGGRALSIDHNEDHADVAPEQALEAALQEASTKAETEVVQDDDSDVEMTDAPNDASVPVSTTSSTGNARSDDCHTHEAGETSDIAGVESDTYEPPDATPSVDSPPFSPAPPDTISEAHTNVQNDMSPGPSDAALTESLQQLGAPLPSILLEDQNAAEPKSRKPFFTPYESPLKNFRAYRFHSKFEEEVQGGFKSITYSNNIKQDKEFCRYELAGGVCNDASCEFQHFRDIGLADDAILVELGNSIGYSEEEKPRFVAGLRTVLQGLRAKKTKDFKVIASEIAAYRTSFLGDKSKVLNLDGTPI